MHLTQKIPQNLSISSAVLAMRKKHEFYTPFGVGLKNRDFISEKYGYGFQNQERDDEMKGEGNSYDFGARIYDNRLSRWLSVDKFGNIYPNISGYVFALNAPIKVIDYGGFTPVGFEQLLKELTTSTQNLYNVEKIVGQSKSVQKMLMGIESAPSGGAPINIEFQTITSKVKDGALIPAPSNAILMVNTPRGYEMVSASNMGDVALENLKIMVSINNDDPSNPLYVANAMLDIPHELVHAKSFSDAIRDFANHQDKDKFLSAVESINANFGQADHDKMEKGLVPDYEEALDEIVNNSKTYETKLLYTSDDRLTVSYKNSLVDLTYQQFFSRTKGTIGRGSEVLEALEKFNGGNQWGAAMDNAATSRLGKFSWLVTLQRVSNTTTSKYDDE
jgi:RHS repeat-associated protein